MAPDRHSRIRLLGSILRVLVVTLVSLALYARAPLDAGPGAGVGADLFALLVVFAAVVAWQIRSVMRTRYPGLRAAEVVAVSVPLLILIFASVYFTTEQDHPGSFTQPMTRIDAVYFAVTVLATVGFGDISAVTETARIFVTIQMLADLVLIGFAARILFGAVRRRRQTLGVDADQPFPPVTAMSAPEEPRR